MHRQMANNKQVSDHKSVEQMGYFMIFVSVRDTQQIRKVFQ